MFEMMKLKKNSERLATINVVIDRFDQDLFIIKECNNFLNVDNGKAGVKQCEMYKKMSDNGLIKHRINNLISDYYNYYCNLISGNDEAIKTAKNQHLNDVYCCYNRDLFKVIEPSLFKKIKLSNGNWIKEPFKIFKDIDEMAEYHQQIKDIKANIPVIKKQAFELARENMTYVTSNKIQNQEYYDRLFFYKFMYKNVKKSA